MSSLAFFTICCFCPTKHLTFFLRLRSCLLAEPSLLAYILDPSSAPIFGFHFSIAPAICCSSRLSASTLGSCTYTAYAFPLLVSLMKPIYRLWLCDFVQGLGPLACRIFEKHRQSPKLGLHCLFRRTMYMGRLNYSF